MALIAESGMGKTRLVQELYRRVASLEQASEAGYWPAELARDGNNLLINPTEASCDPTQPLPFLWWALRLANPSGQNQVATGALAAHVEAHLVPQLEPLARERRRRQRLRDLAKVGGAVAIDAALDLVPGLGLLKKAGEVTLELKGLHDAWRADQRRADAGFAAEERRASLVDKVIADLRLLLERRDRQRGAPAVPAVIVIDDAQFAIADPGLVDFLTALLEAMAAGEWPLLLVITHWQREWQLSGDEASPVAGLVRAYAAERPEDVAIRALAPIADLQPLALAALPGLTAEQLSALLRRVGGNPRYLDEVLRLAALRGRGLHVGRDPHGPLTSEGLGELLASTLDLHQAALARLAASPEEVQQAVVLAALQGDEFVPSLVGATAAELSGADAAATTGAAVADAHAPHAYFAATTDGSSAFAQPLYREIALKRLDYHYDPEAAALALAAATRSAFRAPDRLLGSEWPAALELAARLFEAAEEQADLQVAAHSLHHLMQWAFGSGDVRAAAYLVQRQLAVLERLEDDYLDGDLRWLEAVADLLEQLGREDARAQVLGRLLRLTGAAFDEDVNTWTGCLYARALLSVADYHQSTGDGELLGEALALASQVMNQTPVAADDAWGLTEAVDLNVRLGEVTWRAGEIAAAVPPFEAAAATAAALCQLEPRPENARLLATTERRLARALALAGDAQRAYDLFAHAAVRLRSSLAAGAEPETEAVRRDLATTLELQASHLVAHGGHSEAAALFAESIALRRELLAANPASPGARSELAEALERSADAAAERGALSEAAALAEESLAMRRTLADDVGSPLDISELGAALVRVAQMAAGEEGEALAARRERAREGLELLLDRRSGLGVLPDAWRKLSALELNLELDLSAGSLLTAATLLSLADEVASELPPGAGRSFALKLAQIEGLRARYREACGDAAGALLARQHREALEAVAGAEDPRS